MSPDFQEGDFVVLSHITLHFEAHQSWGHIIFDHQRYGTLIKRIASFDPETAEAYVEGTQPDSLDSRRLGTIRRENIRGKVIAHFPKKYPG